MVKTKRLTERQQLALALEESKKSQQKVEVKEDAGVGKDSSVATPDQGTPDRPTRGRPKRKAAEAPPVRDIPSDEEVENDRPKKGRPPKRKAAEAPPVRDLPSDEEEENDRPTRGRPK